jgi:hypothetical protein
MSPFGDADASLATGTPLLAVAELQAPFRRTRRSSVTTLAIVPCYRTVSLFWLWPLNRKVPRSQQPLHSEQPAIDGGAAQADRRTKFCSNIWAVVGPGRRRCRSRARRLIHEAQSVSGALSSRVNSDFNNRRSSRVVSRRATTSKSTPCFLRLATSMRGLAGSTRISQSCILPRGHPQSSAVTMTNVRRVTVLFGMLLAVGSLSGEAFAVSKRTAAVARANVCRPIYGQGQERRRIPG